MSQSVLRLNTAHQFQTALGKSAKFRQLLAAPETDFLMEAHNGLSAKIVEETGFKGIWASGLSISTALGVRDNNEASWTQVLEVLEFMADATTIPILVDGDTGYGNFNNFRRFVKKLCQRGIAAVCIEDKLFPKTNSFLGEHQPLAEIEEFCGKIKAGKDSQPDDDFCIIARVEALIAGWGLEEALRRAEAYHEAGADGILIHSKRSTADEILAFAREWDGRAPLVIVPTKYYATPTERFREAGISLVIWANHNLRAAMAAMRDVSKQIFEEQSLTGVEERVTNLQDVFAIAGNDELAAAEEKYLAARHETKAIVLAATRGKALRELTVDRPKCMLDVHGKPLLHRLVGSLNDAGVRDITVVTGYKSEAVNYPGIRKVENERYETTGEAVSLAVARESLSGECILCYGDIMFRRYILNLLFEAEGDIVVVVDARWREQRRSMPKHTADLVSCSIPYSDDYLDDRPVELLRVDAAMAEDDADGEWIGLLRLTPSGTELVREEIAAMEADGTLGEASIPDLLNRLIERGTHPRVVYVTGHWLDVNDAFDLARARNFR